MKVITKSEAKEFKNSDSCTAYEYPLGDKDINGAVIKLSGRYPDNGYVVNQVCKELVYVIRGHGSLTTENSTISLNEGDLAMLLAGEKYSFEGEMDMFMPCSPAWYPEQHKEVS